MKRPAWASASAGYLPLAGAGAQSNGGASGGLHRSYAALRLYGLPLLLAAALVTSGYAIVYKRDDAAVAFDRIWSATSSASGSAWTCPTEQHAVAYTPPTAPQPVLEHDSATWPAPTPELPLDADLETRIEAWQSMPVATASEWMRYNAGICPNSKSYENKLWGFVSPQEADGGPWEELWRDPSLVQKMRDDMWHHLRDLRTRGMLDRPYQGTGHGIVLSAGNADTFHRALTTVRLLREHLNSTIAVEIFHFPGETPDPGIKATLEGLGAKVLEAPQLHKDASRQKNWHIKATAMIAASFQHVLYLDSDNMPAFAPDHPTEGIFFGKGYERLGAMFFPDYWKDVGHSPVWQIIGVQCRDEWEQEAGAIVVDKARHLDALHLADYMLRHYKVWFHLSDGDKDLFRYAFLALRKRWAVPGRFVAGASWIKGPAEGFCAHTMLQHDHKGRPTFVHANMLKKIDVWDFQENAPPGSIWGVSATTPAAHIDGDVDCDQLANPSLSGQCIKDAPPNVRARAALERGVRVWFYGLGPWPSCLNVRWDDPRSDDETILSRYMAGLRKLEKRPTHFIGADDDWRSPLYRAKWADDDRLRDFEAAFWRAGGKPTGKGF